jgi:hypothetical protein
MKGENSFPTTDGKTNPLVALATDVLHLPDQKLLQIYRLLEQMGDKPEVSKAVSVIRPRLITLRPPRYPALSRLFFMPAEDLLDDSEHYSRKLNRICRTTLSPCWQAVKDRIPAAVQQDVTREVSRVDYRDGAALAALCEPLWRLGGEALEAVIAECRDNAKFKTSLFGRDDDVQRQLATLRRILTVAPRIEKLKAALPPRPILDLAESHVETIRAALIDLGKADASLTEPLVLVLASRMQRPGDLLSMLGEARLGGASTLKETLMRDMSDYVVGNLLRQAGRFDREQPLTDADPASLAALAERLTEGLNSVNGMVEGLRDKEIATRMKDARAEIGQFVLENVCADVDTRLTDTLFGHGGALPSDEDVKKAEQFALALRRSSKMAGSLGIQKEVTSRINMAQQQVVNNTLAMLRPGGRSMTADAQRQMYNGLRMVEILSGPDEAERLFREWTA